MVDSDDVVLIETLAQCNFVHAAAISGNLADFIAEIVRPLDVGQVFRVFVEKIALGKCPVEGLFKIIFIACAGLAVQCGSVLRHHICNIGRFLHAAFDFKGINFL